jgi:hypothetical protein
MKLLLQREITGNAPPTHLAEYKGSKSISIAPTWLGVSPKLQPAAILANLAIDQDGKFFTASIIKISPPSLQGQKAQYEELLGKIYQNEQFKPAYDTDINNPTSSNLLVRVTIK